MRRKFDSRLAGSPGFQPRAAGIARRFSRGVMGAIIAAFCVFPFEASGQASDSFRIGFSTLIFGEVNENDAIAAVRGWAQAIAREKGIPADPRPVIFREVEEIAAALTGKTVDCLNLTTGEFAEIRYLVPGDSIVAGVMSESIVEEYVLIAHRESGIRQLSDLRGRRLCMLRSARASLASEWLDTLLARDGLGRARGFFGRVDPAANVGKAVLPVFFRQMDACVATLNGFETMVELNPQIGEQLEILATSPSVVPVIFCFRDDYRSPVRSRVMGEIKRWHLSPAGRQILTIFQTDRLEEHPISCLDSAFELLSQYKRLTGESAEGSGGNTRIDEIPGAK